MGIINFEVFSHICNLGRVYQPRFIDTKVYRLIHGTVVFNRKIKVSINDRVYR